MRTSEESEHFVGGSDGDGGGSVSRQRNKSGVYGHFSTHELELCIGEQRLEREILISGIPIHTITCTYV